MSNVNKVKLLSEHTSGVPPVTFNFNTDLAGGPFVHLESGSALCTCVVGQETLQKPC